MSDFQLDELSFEGFDESQNKSLQDFASKMDQMLEAKARKVSEEALNDAIETRDQLDLTDFDKSLKVDEKNFESFNKIWRGNGHIARDKRVGIKDLVEKDFEVTKRMQDQFSTDQPLYLERVVTQIAREAIEPALTLTPLLTRINYSAGSIISFPSWGAMVGAADMAEGEEYPEQSMELAGQVTADIGKAGIAFKVTEEMLRYNQFDVLNAHIRAAGRALARHKEVKVADLITQDQGNVIFDNIDTSVKSTTGRDAAGAYNGTLTVDDMFYAYAEMVNRGFPANTLVMHPFAWQVFAQDGIARAFGFENGFAQMMWQTAQGMAGNAGNPWRQNFTNMNTYVSSPENIATTFTNVPSIFPTTFNIIVSPYMPYNPANQTTDIIFADVNEMGILIVDEEVTSDEWMDHARDIRKMKFRERYGLATQNDGKTIGLMKNIKIGKSFDFSDKLAPALVTPSDAITGDGSNTGDVIS